MTPVPTTNHKPKSDEPSRYRLLRYDEDYSFLRDADRRTDFWDWAKYVPCRDEDGWYASFGTEARQWFEYYNNFNFGAIPGGNGYLLQRYLIHGDVHLGPDVRFFGQFMSGIETGRIGGPRPDVDQDDFDVHQAFIDLVQHLGQDDSLTWRLGRQEMMYGSGRLIDVREGVNLRRSFDAARILMHLGHWSVDGFWSRPVLNRPGVFDDIPYPNLSLWGLYGVHSLSWLPKSQVDLYYLGYENTQATFDNGTARELRNSLGMRLSGQPQPWEYDFEAIWQFGRFGSGNLMAWAFASATRFNVPELPLHPYVGFVGDVTSGNQNPHSTNLQTFNPMFPTGAYLNLANPIGPANFIQAHPSVGVHLGERITADTGWAFVWRESIHDGIYGPFVGPPIRTGQLSTARYVGSSPTLTVSYSATRHLSFVASYVHFFAGTFLKETPPGKDMDYLAFWLDYMF